MANDKPVSVRTRFEVFKRDRFTCQYCGANPPSVVLELDHIIPRSDDGDNSIGNLITACWGCNRGKSNKSLDSIPRALSEQIAERKERAMQVAQFNAFLMEERENLEIDAAQIGIYWCDTYSEQKGEFCLLQPREQSIKTFLKHLTKAEILDAIDIATARWPGARNREHRNAWKYFCGVCWSTIKQKPQG